MSNPVQVEPEQPTPSGAAGSRGFVLIALGLMGLLVVGLALVFGYLLYGRMTARPTDNTQVAPAVAASVSSTPAANATRAAIAQNVTPAASVTRAANATTLVAIAVGTNAPSAIGAGDSSNNSSTGGGSPTPNDSTTNNDSNLPNTGIEEDILIVGALMLGLLVVARGFRMTLH